LGELPPISSLVDSTEVRVLAEEVTAFVFELPVRAATRNFPRKNPGGFRVNKTQRAFEDIT